MKRGDKTRPRTPAELDRVVELALHFLAVHFGGVITTRRLPASNGRAAIAFGRATEPSPPLYPSLVDGELEWIVVQDFARGEEIGVLWFDREHRSAHVLARPLPYTGERALSVALRRVAHEAASPPFFPAPDEFQFGAGAWEQAAALTRRTDVFCASCPYRFGSNLDCPRCRAEVLGRKSAEAAWDRSKIRDGLLALDFHPEVADEAAAAAEETLTKVHVPLLTYEFFRAWTRRFEDATATLFVNELDRAVARDLIEAQMLAPWFALPPPREPAPEGLEVPPARTEEELKTEARAMLRSMMKRGTSRTDARYRVQTLKVLRKMLLGQAELFGDGARVVGGLADCRLLVEQDGRPVLLVTRTLVGSHEDWAPELAEADRARILDRLYHAAGRLVNAVRLESEAMKSVDPDGRAIDRAMAILRRSIDHDPPLPKPPARTRPRKGRPSMQFSAAEFEDR